MQPLHFSLESAIRPGILAIPAYVTSTSDESQPRASILLDANENSLGSCLTSCPPSKLQTNGHAYTNGHTNGHAHTNGHTHANGHINTNGHSYTNGTNGHSSANAKDYLALAFSESASLHRYPSSSQWQLKRVIADWRGVPDVRNVCLGVGAADLVDLVIRMSCAPQKDAILITPPTFGLYMARAAINEVDVVECPLEVSGDDFTLSVQKVQDVLASSPQIKIVFLASPGNPTGTLIPLSDIKSILDFPKFKGILVVDEAYIDFCSSPDGISAVALLSEYSNLLVIQTLSKSHGLAGIRVGMAFGHPAVIEILQKIQMPYCVSTPTSTLAMLALSPASTKLRDLLTSRVIANREALIRALGQSDLIDRGVGRPLGGNQANFIVLPILERGTGARDNARAKTVSENLKKDHGIAVRFIGGLPGCEGSLRITVGTEDENEHLVARLSSVLDEC